MSPKVVLSFALAALLGSAVVSCSLAVDLDPLNAGCAEDEKFCPANPGEAPSCVKKSPDVGCGRANCAICSPPNADANCLPSGECGVAQCKTGGWQDCNGDPADGCEVNWNSDPNNCGACNRVCTLPHVVTQGCSARQCVKIACEPGYEDCNNNSVDGCETSLALISNCNECGRACTTGQNCVQVATNTYDCR